MAGFEKAIERKRNQITARHDLCIQQDKSKKMKYYVATLLFALLAVVTSCKSKEQVSEKTMTESTTTEENEGKKAGVLEIDKSYNARATDPFTVKSTEVSGKILKITVTYSGGCEEHEFALKANGAVMKSMPPQMPITLEHNANGDNCRSLIEETLKFDISAAEQGSNGEVILILNGDRENRISYKYQ